MTKLPSVQIEWIELIYCYLLAITLCSTVLKEMGLAGVLSPARADKEVGEFKKDL